MKFGTVYNSAHAPVGTINYNDQNSNGRFDIFKTDVLGSIIYGNIRGNNVYIYDAQSGDPINGYLNGNRIYFSDNPYKIAYVIL